jgi:alpha-mannosidase
MSGSSNDRAWTVFVLPSSHNDIGWAGTPSEIAEHRADAIIDTVLSKMESEPDFAFTVEAALYLREYADRRPSRLPLLVRFLQEGRLECGASYIQPYEGLLSGEGLIRQIVWGRGWLGTDFGIQADGYWNIDVAGRSLQMPQILAKSGVRYMVLSRNQPGLYWWEAPDGSRILTLSFYEGDYGHSPILKPISAHFSPLEPSARPIVASDVSPESIAGNLVPLLERWEAFFARHSLPRYLLLIATADYAVPDERLRSFVDDWNAQAESGELQLPFRVNLKLGNVASYLAALESETDLSGLDVMKGELPNPWIYIHGPCHHKTVTAMRDAAFYLSTAETFGVVRHIANGDHPSATAADLEPAWLAHLYPDHGYGGLHGEGTDELFRQMEESAKFTARQVARKLMTEHVRTIPLGVERLRNLTVFNPFSWERTDWVECEAFFSVSEQVASIDVVDECELPVPFQPIEISRSASGILQRVRLGFIAAHVPSVGYRTYRLVPGNEAMETSPTELNSRVPEDFRWENEFARIRITRGGMVEWFDRKQRRNLLSPDHYLGFEVVELGSPGHDVGVGERDIEIYDWKANRPFQPTPHGLERTAERGGELKILEDGPVRTRVTTLSRFSHCRLSQTFSLYRGLDRADVSVEVRSWDGAHGRELRLVFPIGVPVAAISYDVPFGHVDVGRDEVPYFSDLRPREVQTWIHAKANGFDLTLSGSVVAHDWVDPLHLTTRPVLQAILLATKRSCHTKGPWYSQEGNHSFSASISGSPGTLTERTRFGWGCRHPMEVIVASNGETPADPRSPPTKSFLSFDQPNIALSALKSGVKDGEVVVRCWEIEGVPTRVALSFPTPVREVWSCDMLERERECLWSDKVPSRSFPVHVDACGILTLKLKLDATP